MNNKFKIKKCRFCESSDLTKLIFLGNQYLSGVFPKSLKEKITSGPLTLVKCKRCTLVQLENSFDLNELYGKNYGYRTSLNSSMVNHISKKLLKLEKFLSDGDTVLDIGSNDGTLLKLYRKKNIKKVGIDPTILKFKKYYPKKIKTISKFFSVKNYDVSKNGKAKIITSLAMFYDLESPYEFAKNVERVLHDKGIWHLEQHYLPLMLECNSYDQICHEHLEYYSLKIIEKILKKANLKIHEIEINSVNGGSIAVTAVKEKNILKQSNPKLINYLLFREKKNKIFTLKPYIEFNSRVKKLKNELIKILKDIKLKNKKIFGYGASTKGNIILQYCNIDRNLLPCIIEVNEDKYGKFTPGTHIPIISEKKARKLKPDYFLVFPWHFKKMIIKKEKKFLASGGKLIFPLPNIEIIDKNYHM